jgi:Rod binding domain-containing protein
MDAISSTSPSSYLDFDGLGQLKGQARTDAKGAIRETAQQFEALFLQMMMKSMRESIVKSELSESTTMETFEGMFDKEVSVQLASISTTAEILKQRQDPAAFNATVKGMALNPKTMGISLEKLSDRPSGIALPKPQILPLNLPAKPISGGSGK